MEHLQLELERELNRLKRGIYGMQWDDARQYGTWLWQTHYFVCHSTRLLALAASRFPVAQAKLHSRFISHASEEKGHEFLALKDYEVLKKMNPGLPDRIEELPSTQLFYQSQYYWIEHRDPASFFGYILVLESMASVFGRFAFELVRDAHGEKAATFLRVHAEEDPDHIKKALESIAQLSRDSNELIVANLKLSSAAYTGICDSISAHQRAGLKLVA
jgi:hypothetical protein